MDYRIRRLYRVLRREGVLREEAQTIAQSAVVLYDTVIAAANHARDVIRAIDQLGFDSVIDDLPFLLICAPDDHETMVGIKALTVLRACKRIPAGKEVW